MTDSVRSNCLIWSWLLFRRRFRAWVKAGRPAGLEPYWVKRPTRNEPTEVLGVTIWHYFVGHLGPDGNIVVASFKPIAPTDVPWWLGWSHAWFEGRAVYGDRPEPYLPTQPPP
jgi:hypothetical protein